MTFGPIENLKKHISRIQYTRADDSFRQLGRHVWCLPALVIIRLTIFFYRENNIFANLHTIVKINTTIMQ